MCTFAAAKSRCSAVGSVPGLGPGCRRFESCHLDPLLSLKTEYCKNRPLARADGFSLSHAHRAFCHYRQLVVPRAVKAAVRMLTMTCRMVFQVSFFMVLMV